DGLRVRLFVIEPGPPGAVRMLGRLLVGRRWRPVEVRVDAWSAQRAELRVAPEQRGIYRKPPGREFYAAADDLLARL
ncbi:hypothetical protein NL529_34700, partial [Klebsiella pneumoniae]|nr:hypothetical protein [Klebsiella pneumoniae]